MLEILFLMIRNIANGSMLHDHQIAVDHAHLFTMVMVVVHNTAAISMVSTVGLPIFELQTILLHFGTLFIGWHF